MKQVRNTTMKAILATLGVGALLAACGGTGGGGGETGGAGQKQTVAAELATGSSAFDVSDLTGWVPFADPGSSITPAQGSGHDATSAHSLQMTYQIATGGYVGLEHRFATPVDWSGVSAIKLWVNGQGAGQNFRAQIYDSGGERWEGHFTVGFTGWQQVTIPFGSLKEAGWQPTGATVNGAEDFAGVTGMALIPADSGNGTISVDALTLGAGADATSVPAGLVTTSGVNGTIVPLYTDPSDASWDAVVAAKQAHPTVPVLAVINPSNGPGTAVQASYTNGIAKLTAAGIKVIGYVHTSYAARATADVETDVTNWHTWYPGVTGIFFDEMANTTGHESYYCSLSANAKTMGFDFTIGNPGADAGESYVGAVDVVLIYENAGVPAQTAVGGWHASYARSNFGVIPYGVPAVDAAFVAAARPTVGYIYLQSSGMPNPWAAVPAYLSDLLGALQ
jgi:hypothetical protein